MDEKRGEIVNIERFFSGECDAREAEVCFLQNLRSILKIVLTSQLFFALVNRASSPPFTENPMRNSSNLKVRRTTVVDFSRTNCHHRHRVDI